MKTSRVISSERRYRHRTIKVQSSGCIHKASINLRLSKLFKRSGIARKRVALVLDAADFATSTALLQGTRAGNRKTNTVIVTNPCAFKCSTKGVTVVSTTVEAFLKEKKVMMFDLIYLDFCSSFCNCFDTVESSVMHLARSGTLAYTVCNRGLGRAEIAFNALRHRELALRWNLTMEHCVAYRDMVTIIMTRGYKQSRVSCKLTSEEGSTEVAMSGKFLVERFEGWRVNHLMLQIRVRWVLGESTWEPAEDLVKDLDRATFMRLVHEM